MQCLDAEVSHHHLPCQGDEFVLVSLALEGRAQVSQEGREAVLEVGDFAIYDTRRPYRLHFDCAFRQTVVQIPRKSLQQRLCNLE
ncbi:AraC family transcriptional regulator, partial [Pseudomonas syringae pv. tomato]|nr:AraC family transcriptional regulator [Pseudomonas syringae pv. tomato]